MSWRMPISDPRLDDRLERLLVVHVDDVVEGARRPGANLLDGREVRGDAKILVRELQHQRDRHPVEPVLEQ